MISLITVCYNSEKTLQRTIDSVKRQNIKNLEYIFIDGCSKDRTFEIINKNKNDLEKAGVKISVIREPDTGIYNAMNKGIKLAKGNIIAILNSDDYYLDNTLKIVEKEIEDFDILIGNMFVFRGNNQELKKSKLNLNNKMSVCHPAMFVKKEVYNKNGSFDESFKISADYDFISRCYINGVKIKLIDQVLTMMDGTGSSNQKKFFKQIVFESNKVRWKNKFGTINNIIYFLRDYLKYIYTILGIYKIKKFVKNIIN